MSSPRYRSPDRRHPTLEHVLGAGAVDFRPVAVAIARDATLSPSCLGKSANLTKAIGTLSGTEIEVNMTSPTIVGVGARVGCGSGANRRAIASGGSPGVAHERPRSSIPSGCDPSANQSLAVLFPRNQILPVVAKVGGAIASIFVWRGSVFIRLKTHRQRLDNVARRVKIVVAVAV